MINGDVCKCGYVLITSAVLTEIHPDTVVESISARLQLDTAG